MRLGPPAPRPGPTVDVAAALTAAVAALGQRPAVTVLLPDARHEQGYVSLAGWAAKGAHLLRDELALGPGDVLGVDAPPSWPLAAVALAAWWAGIALGPVVPGRPGVVHAGRPDPGGDVWWLGDAVDGGVGSGRSGGEDWTAAAIPYPDRPPAPAAHPDLTAVVRADGTVTTQKELLAAWGDDAGVLGIRWREGAGEAGTGLDLLGPLAVRPLVTGAATVVVHEGDEVVTGRATAAERVVRWW